MLYLKRKRAFSGLNETFCEKVERRSTLNQRPLTKTKSFLFLALAGLTLVTANCFAWDGAGDTWTCGNCGKSNYTWQNSCTKCGKS